ncbi:MAG: spondin domain-containing protein [Gammaproteobacteria bacterium]|jgi:hypothetical protein
MAAAIMTGMVLAAPAHADHNYAVTVTNLTNGMTFTPILVASHRFEPHLLFNAGDAASAELATVAEAGDVAPLTASLEAQSGVGGVTSSAALLPNGLLLPGESVTVEIKARPGRDRLSLVAMLIPTNDGFFAFQNLPLPRGRHASVVEYSPAYDAGSEPNDELCMSIPGPTCGGQGSSPGVDGEGYVHIHRGIHGIGDLQPAVRDWRNPVTRVIISRTK